MSKSSRRTRRLLLAVPALAVAFTLVACSAGSDDSAGSAAEPAMAGDVADGDAPAAMRDAAVAEGGAAMLDSSADGATDQGGADPASYTQSYVISTGAVSYRSKDVGETRFDVQAVIDAHGGRTDEEKSETDDDGGLLRSRMVFRVPVKEFPTVMAELDKLDGKQTSSSSSEDVTTQVIDTDVRVKSQQRSIERIQVLFARAQSIRDIMAIEAQLQQREADLDSLKQQQAWLAGQTSWSTVTVNLQREHTKKAAEKEDTGFLAGLTSGWHGLEKVTVGLATAVGAMLPFAVVLLVLGIPVWLVTRRLLAHRGHDEPAPLPAES